MPNFADVIQADLHALEGPDFEPITAAAPDEEIVGEMPTFARRLYTLASAFARQSAQHGVAASFGATEEERKRASKQMSACRQKSQAVMEVMWCSVCEEYDCWGEALGLRKGWLVVRCKEQAHPMAHLFGLGG